MDLKPLHGEILVIAEYFHEFCKQHNLTYYLLGGTALGSVRHAGFIPWDDDFDVCMPQKDYLKFLSLQVEIDEKFLVEVENTSNFRFYFSKLKLKGSFYLESENQKSLDNNLIFIDIMCLSDSRSHIIFTYIQFLCAKALSASAIDERGWCESRVKRLISKTTRFLPVWVKRKMLEFVRYEHYQSEYYIHFFGRAPFKKALIRREYAGEPVLQVFEDHQFFVFSDLNSYLKARFGDDFLAIPSQQTIDFYKSHCIDYSVRRGNE